MWRLFAGAATAMVLAAVASLAVIYSGVYNVAARNPMENYAHLALDTAMERSVFRHARSVTLPEDYGSEEAIRRGLVLYHDLCVQCHGGPGLRRGEIGRGLQPHPTYLWRKSRHWEWSAKEIYWIIRNGIQYSGMPAWDDARPESDLWSIVAFIDKSLPKMSRDGYRSALTAAGRDPLKSGGPISGTVGVSRDLTRFPAASPVSEP